MADELAKSKEETKRAQADMERLLDVMQVGQEEQNTKENTIRELQELVFEKICNAFQMFFTFRRRKLEI